MLQIAHTQGLQQRSRMASWVAVLTLLASVWSTIIPEAMAKPFVWARSSDALTLDPHAVNEGTTHALNHHIYEPLIIRSRTGHLEPALAKSWTQTLNANVWLFELRERVVFHSGQPLTAEDVLYSLRRALSATSDLRTRLQGVKAYKVNAFGQIEITTHVPDPLLPIRLTDIFIMSKAWSEEHGVTKPQNYLAGENSYAATHANGTGPYRLKAREPGKLTHLVRNEGYWGWHKETLNERIKEIIYKPIADDKERITALLDGAVDYVQDVPLSELDVLRQAPDLTLKSGPENRVIFLGMSVRPTTTAGKTNPLKHIDARKAIAHAIDRFAIQRDIMRGQSIPTGVLAPPGINGFPRDLDQVRTFDLAVARKHIQSAGISEGTQITLDCPNNRYVNDAAICAAVAQQLGEIGLNVTLALHTKTAHFRKVRSGQSQLFLLGWGVPTFDSAYIFTNLFHTRTANIGSWNGTGFSNPGIDQRIVGLAALSGNGDRSRSIDELWFSARDAMIYVPLHVQTLVYAMRAGVNIEVDISNTPKLKHATVAAKASHD